MFDIGWSELMLIGIVSLIVVGPKDLPGMFHALGRFTAKARSMAREFSKAMDEAAKESGVGDVAKDLKGMTSAKSLGLDSVQKAAAKFEAWDPMKKSAPVVKGPATQALTEERAEAKAKIEKAAADRALARQAKAEAAADEADVAEPAIKPADPAKPKAAKAAAKPKAAPKAKADPGAAGTAKRTAKPKADPEAPKKRAAPKKAAK